MKEAPVLSLMVASSERGICWPTGAGFRIQIEIEKLHVARRGRLEFAACGPGILQFAGGAATVHDEVQKEHQHKDAAESDHDGGAGGRVKLDAEVTTERRNQGAHGPTNRQTRADAV